MQPPTGGAPPFKCWSCGEAIESRDHYCRSCGQGQGAFLAWYYRPIGIALAFTLIGPFALLLVWRTPRLDQPGKWIASLAIVAVCGYVAWQLVLDVQQIGELLDAP